MGKNDRYIFGIHAVQEAINAGKELEKVLVRRGIGSEPFNKLVSELHMLKVPVQQVPVEKLNRVTGKNHQGIIAFMAEISYHDITQLLPTVFESGEDPLILLLDGVSDVRNFGAIARSAECAGVHAIVIPFSGSAAVNADAVKTSAGALHRIPVCRQEDMVSVLKFLRESGLSLFGATEKAEQSIYESDLKGPAGFVVGSEEKGISAPLLKEIEHWVSIPMKGKIASLNVSVAAGIVLFEALRQRA
jgi:23S rRNA (guanosine2251-2'-O)-methyltransferase